MIQFQYAPGEYARALRRYRIRYFHLRRDVPIAALLAVAAVLLRDQGWWFWALGGVAAAYLVVVGLSIGLHPAVLAPRSRPHLREPYTLRFSEDQIDFSTPSTRSTLPWSIYKGWCRDAEFVYLALGHGHATILPRRALGGPEQEAALFQLLGQKLGREGLG